MEIIAEIGQNHNGDIKLACELIHAAKENGADVAKFQLYDAKSLFPKVGNEWYEYNLNTELKRDQVILLAEECRAVKIEFMASAFDSKRVGWLEDLEVKRYKIASRSIYDVELLRAIAVTGKPMIVSLGMWQDIEFPKIDTSAPVYFLYCVSKYPAKLSDLKLGSVDFNKYSGFSDHSTGITACVVAFSLGSKIVEKHFTLDKTMYGPDHSCSMTPEELKRLNDLRIEIAECL